jgi:aryl-alcohol dehydrogenase-like predicted oxidoreductase
MRIKTLGRSGLRVSEIALGTMTFGTAWGWGADAATCAALYAQFRNVGGTFIDSANFYTNGESEQITGKLIAPHRSEIVLGTKFASSMADGNANASGLGRKNMIQAVEASLKRLGTEYIDLYWLHIWDFLTPVEEVMRGLDDLVRSGKVLYVGVSDTPAWIISEAQILAALRGWSPFVGLQINYSLIERTVERELIPMARARELGVVAWSPLAQGVLTGKYNHERSNDGKGTTNRDARPGLRGRNERGLAIAKAVEDLAGEIGHSPAQVALSWVRAKGAIPLLGAANAEQLKDNLGTLNLELTTDQIAMLDAVSAIVFGFPHDFYPSVLSALYGTYGQTLDVNQLEANGATQPLLSALRRLSK